MGDPKKQRRSYSKPRILWNIERIEREKGLVKKYGLKNMRELWRVESLLRSFRRRARMLMTAKTTHAEKEKSELLGRLATLNVLKKDAVIEDVLTLNVEDLLGRRFQTIVQKKGLANTPKQARQFIIHGHVTVGGNKVTSPSYLIRVNEENDIKMALKVK